MIHFLLTELTFLYELGRHEKFLYTKGAMIQETLKTSDLCYYLNFCMFGRCMGGMVQSRLE